jgi:MFS family permease
MDFQRQQQLPEPAAGGIADTLRIYVAIPAAMLLFNSGFFLIRNPLPNYLNEAGLAWLAGPMQAVLPATALLLAVPMGLLADRFSPRKLSIIGFSIFSMFAALVYLMDEGEPPPVAILVAAYFLCGVSVVMVANTIRPLYYKCISGSHQHAKLAFFQAVVMIGFGLGSFVAGLAYKFIEWPLSMQFRLALPFGLLGLVAAVLMKDSAPTPFSMAAYRKSILRRPVIIFLGMVFVNALHFGVESVCVAPFVKRGLDGDDFLVGMYFGSIALVLAVTALLTIWLRDHATNRRRMWTWGLAVSAVFNISMLLVSDPWQFFVLRYAHVIADAFMIVASLQIIAAMFPKGRSGGPMGLVSVIQTVGMLVGALMAGAIMQSSSLTRHWQLSLPFAITGVLVLLVVGMQLVLRERFEGLTDPA